MNHAEVMRLAKRHSQAQGDTGTLARALLLYGAVRHATEGYETCVNEFGENQNGTDPSAMSACSEHYDLIETRLIALEHLIPYDGGR